MVNGVECRVKVENNDSFGFRVLEEKQKLHFQKLLFIPCFAARHMTTPPSRRPARDYR